MENLLGKGPAQGLIFLGEGLLFMTSLVIILFPGSSDVVDYDITSNNTIPRVK